MFGVNSEASQVNVLLSNVGELHQEKALARMLNEVYGISWTLSMDLIGKHVNPFLRHVISIICMSFYGNSKPKQ